jgi:beta-glucosidase
MSSSAALIKAPIEENINHLINQMTPEEKIGQLNQVHAFNDQEKNAVRSGQIGSIINATSAFAGLGSSPSSSAELCNAIQKVAVEESRLHIPVLFGRDVIHGYRTVFPIPLGQAASWNPEMVELASAVAAAEASADGIKWTFAPMLDIARDPRWGRVAEGYGEDPLLASMMASAAVKGFQGNDLSAAHKIVACAKHFVGYGAAQGGRDYESAEISTQTLRDVYLPPYKAVVDAGVGTIMAAFHDLNGNPLSANHELLTDVLRHEWNFKGFVVSDWNSIAELVNHGTVSNESEASISALTAGVDMDMVSGVYARFLFEWFQNGILPQEVLDEAVRRVLRIKYLAGLFEQPYTDPRRGSQIILSKQNRNAAHLLAQQSIVLLKNSEQILPIQSSFKRILFAGPMRIIWNLDT